jgi:LmbE family N-acetylglucosaminyl deacetylase
MVDSAEAARRNIVMIAAHPDDIAHGMGGTAWLLKDKYQLNVLCLTKGERGLSREVSEETASIREKEEAAACKLLGANLTFLGLIDGEVFAGREICERVAEILKELDPIAVFAQWPVNVPDHTAAFTIAMKACSLAGIYHTTEFYMLENGVGGQTNQFEPDMYVDISDVVEHKKDLIRCHACQFRGENHIEKILSRNVFRGLLARCDYAEPFKTINPPVNRRWGSKTGNILLDL